MARIIVKVNTVCGLQYCFNVFHHCRLDVTEAQFGVMIVDIIAGIFGPSVFSSQVSVNVLFKFCTCRGHYS